MTSLLNAAITLNILETDKNKKRVDSMETMMNTLESVKASCLKNKPTYITDIELAEENYEKWGKI